MKYAESDAFFKHQALALPLVWQPGPAQDVVEFLRNRFEVYQGLVSALAGDDSVSATIKEGLDESKELQTRLLNSIRSSFMGRPAAAIKEFDTGLQCVNGWIDKLIVKRSDPITLPRLFRCRVDASPVRLGKADLFHIPFELRTKVAPQRFSYPGVPCLYLGGSIYICWRELREPPFHMLAMSRFEIASDVNALIFMRPDYLGEFFSILDTKKGAKKKFYENIIAAHGVCWPLLAGTAVCKARLGDPFVPEYIVPQLLLRWIIENKDLHGLHFISTREQRMMDDPSVVANWVFPAKTTKPTGHCDELARLFRLTDPLPWSLGESLRAQADPDRSKVSTGLIRIAGRRELRYHLTEFGLMEALLDGSDATTL